MNVYEIVTSKIIEQLKTGVAPWRSPYLVRNMRNGGAHNFKTKHCYTGINTLLTLGAQSHKFLTFKQAQDLGGMVKKGSKGFMIVYYGQTTKTVETNGIDQDKTFSFLKYSTVFDSTQIEGIDFGIDPELPVRPQNEVIQICDQLAKSYLEREKIEINNYRNDVAYYSSNLDAINMPELNLIRNSPEFYSTLFHEIVHSTGHKSRLDRGLLGQMTINNKKVKEELIAEIGASFLSAKTGILDHVIDNSVAYCNHWLGILKDDPKLVISASSLAQKAVDFIETGKKPVVE